MHAATADKGGGAGGSWRLPQDETLQVGDSGNDDDFAYGSESHNWRSIIFALLVINFVIGGIVTTISLIGYVRKVLLLHIYFHLL